jgi:predicted AlkP superfamily pyrophosphatase or phosphodiesterase
MQRRFVLVLLLVSPFVWWALPKTAAQVRKPRLVILLAIDQMRADYFTRFGARFTGGLKRLHAEGRVFTNADLNYARTETAPGHATLATGAYPRRHGIPANEWFDRQAQQTVYCVADKTAGSVEGAGGGASPKHLTVKAVGDWLKAASPASKVIAAAGKDRAAVLLGGQRPDLAFWYEAKTGLMVTSDYYTRQAPDWVKAFNAADWTTRNTPAAWTKLLPESEYSGPDDFRGERLWGPSRKFPHPFLRKTENQRTSPYYDMLVLDFALAAIRAEKLGQDDAPDLLCVGLSATDYVGHHYGPDSHEMQDHLLRLDRALGDFLTQVEKLAGAGNVLLVLSADHGVRPNPEYLTEFKAAPARRISHDAIETELFAISDALQQELGLTESVLERRRWRGFRA